MEPNEFEFEISIPETLYRFFTLPLVKRVGLILYGLALFAFAVWFVWFINAN